MTGLNRRGSLPSNENFSKYEAIVSPNPPIGDVHISLVSFFNGTNSFSYI